LLKSRILFISPAGLCVSYIGTNIMTGNVKNNNAINSHIYIGNVNKVIIPINISTPINCFFCLRLAKIFDVSFE
jgi:hypothetical protein